MRVLVLAVLLAVSDPVTTGQPPAPATPPATPPAAPASAAPASMQAPRLPPFAGTVVNFDRRGEKVVACVDASAATPPGKPGASTPPAKPAGPPPPPRYRIWVIEREVMQELLTTAGLCDPMWSPDGKSFAAAGQRGVFVFTAPNFEPTVLVAGLAQPPAPGDPPPRQFDDPVWSPGGGKVAFRVSGPSARVEVVDVKSAEVLLRRDGAAKALRWADERALLVDGTRVPLP